VVLVFWGTVKSFEKLPLLHVGDHGAPVRVGLTVMVHVEAPMTEPLTVTVPPGPRKLVELAAKELMERGRGATVTTAVFVTVPTMFPAVRVKV
jgi:hypothetical protein